MKEGFVTDGPKVEIRDTPQPKPGPKQVVIRVIVSGSNPKDWKVPKVLPTPLNQGDDVAGYVHEVGSEVFEFKPGDRVAAFHEMLKPYGSYGEFSLAEQHTTFHISATTSFEEAATLPLAAMTAAIGLFHSDQLALPAPWTPAKQPIPLVIYGASSAVGSYALQFAQRANIHPVIAVAGKAAAHVEKLIDRSKGDSIVDYRQDDVPGAIRKALGSEYADSLYHAYDAVSEHNSYVQLGEVLAQSPSKQTGAAAKITLVLPGRKYEDFPTHVEKHITSVGASHKGSEDFAYVYFRYIARGVQEGWFKPQPHEVVPGGLEGVQKGLENLRDGKASATKYVFRISETPGLEKHAEAKI
ncbi:chaperonin 10-like protein [Microdochium trichocladiopsis]|uniref:Chaperonin 10-like protein n=1 Tax=Microdochium trichocladiopsis TaxID=1682393 RepID=A0A9P8Y526_9PEZI|nr:chaperonin 10-like protein [Microdochium trichocladiopsis]KAH7027770.1 chaperonin 10-like protein [Microdochium trichocladiopsis]